MFFSKIIFGKSTFSKYYKYIFRKYYVIDLTNNLQDFPDIVDLDFIIKSNRGLFIEKINGYLKNLNLKNKSIEWYANDFSSKNPLSSPLINRFLCVIAILEFIKANKNKGIIIFGATSGQKCAIKSHFNFFSFFILEFYIRYFISLLQTYKYGKKYIKEISDNFVSNKLLTYKNFDIGILTYVDGSNSKKFNDKYFGNLIHEIKKSAPEIDIAYLSYIYVPFKANVAKLSQNEQEPWIPLFSILETKDLNWISKKIVNLILNPSYNLDVIQDLHFNPKFIIKEVLLEEMRFGYINNLIMYKVGSKISEKRIIKKIIYPFENKSLEKCFLLGLGKLTETIGYQHSSITPRHFSLLMSSEEIQFTPLPDKIVTSGSITYQWLKNIGNFPSERLQIGCSLRFKHFFSNYVKDFSSNSAKLFLATSSSYSELLNSIKFLIALKKLNRNLSLRLRTHIDFPLDIMPLEIIDWVNNNVEISKENSLDDNFKWADITLYVSSTVALESLMFGIPVIFLDIEVLDSDPLLSDIPYKWKVNSPRECIKVIDMIASLGVYEKKSMAKNALNYINSYFVPQDNKSYKLFLN